MIDVKTYKNRYLSDSRWRRRVNLVAIGTILVIDYLLISALADKNVFDIIPSIPKLEQRQAVTLYVPVFHSDELSSEKVLMDTYKSRERTIDFIVNRVLAGSRYENTAPFVPVDILLKNVWLTGDNNTTCVLDFQVSHLEAGRKVIPGSEKKVIQGITRSIQSVFPEITSVLVLNHGITGVPLWELQPKGATGR